MNILLYLFLTAATSGSASYGNAPVTTCIKTTIRANGVTNDSSVAVTSGSRSADRYALRIIRTLKFPRGQDQPGEPQTGYVLVDTYEDGGFGLSLVKYHNRLLESCMMPPEGRLIDFH